MGIWDVYACVCRQAHPCIYTEKPEINPSCLPQLLSTLTEPPSEPGVQRFLSWLATELHISSCFHHLSTEISEACHYTQLSYVSAGVHTTGGWASLLLPSMLKLISNESLPSPSF